MCGEKTASVEAMIESTRMKVCSQCARFGKILKEIPVQATKKEKEKEQHSFVRQQEPEIVEALVPDYGHRIRKAREKLGLNQKDFAAKLNEKESVIHKLETGEFHLSLENAKKMERILHINLVTKYEEEKRVYAPGEAPEMTLGDLFKKK